VLFAFLGLSLAAPAVFRLQKSTRHLAGATLKRGVLTNLEKAGQNDIWTIPVSIGTPARTFNLMIDTGSSDVIVYGQSCPDTQCPGPKYDTGVSTSEVVPPCADSSTWEANGFRMCNVCNGTGGGTCWFESRYSDGSGARGSLLRDTMQIGSDSMTATFGLISETFAGSADFMSNNNISGIFGLRPSWSDHENTYSIESLLFTLLRQKNMSRGFTLCMTGDNNSDGSLIIGEDYPTDSINTTRYKWAPLNITDTYVSVLESLSMSTSSDNMDLLFSDPVPVPAAAVVFDTGVAGLVFPTYMETDIKNHFLKYCPGLKGLCDVPDSMSVFNQYVSMSPEELDQWPTLGFAIKGAAVLPLEASQYFREVNGMYTISIRFAGDIIYLGTNFLRNFRVAFDVERNRIGFAGSEACLSSNPAQPGQFRIVTDTRFEALTLKHRDSYKFASYCGYQASPKAACTVATDPDCGTDAATKPSFAVDCQSAEFSDGVFWGQPAFGLGSHASMTAHDLDFAAPLPAGRYAFLFASVKYANPSLDGRSDIRSITVNTQVTWRMDSADDTSVIASFPVRLRLTVRHYGACSGRGCPWNDPEQWVNDYNADCGEDGYLRDGTPCCPYRTPQNAENLCASKVAIPDGYDSESPVVSFNGKNWAMFVDGAHVGNDHNSLLMHYIVAPRDTVTQLNIHGHLIEPCPKCPAGMKQIALADGRCQCQCNNTCNYPLAQQPDCSCQKKTTWKCADCFHQVWFCTQSEIDHLKAIGCRGSIEAVGGCTTCHGHGEQAVCECVCGSIRCNEARKLDEVCACKCKEGKCPAHLLPNEADVNCGCTVCNPDFKCPAGTRKNPVTCLCECVDGVQGVCSGFTQPADTCSSVRCVSDPKVGYSCQQVQNPQHPEGSLCHPADAPENVCLVYQCVNKPVANNHFDSSCKVVASQPGNFSTPCQNSDSDLCTFDFCDGQGHCSQHKNKQCHNNEGTCVKSSCVPATGECQWQTNFDGVCCEEIFNGRINTGEQCEPNLLGSDAMCCDSKCRLRNTCVSTHPLAKDCTAGTCVDTGKTLQLHDGVRQGRRCELSFLNNSKGCGEVDECTAGKCVPDAELVGKCTKVPINNGKSCSAAKTDNVCMMPACVGGECRIVVNGSALARPCKPAADAPKLRESCEEYQCVQQGNEASCVPVLSPTATCSNDDNLCTKEKCKLDADGVRGVCAVSEETACDAIAVTDCHSAAKCNPATGKCEPVLKADGVSCSKEEWLSHHNNTLSPSLNPELPCASYQCQAGQCSMVQTTPCCGNGILEDGEQCDYFMHRFADCCSKDCKGCLCGNGKIDAGEQCDWGITDQASCCNMQCSGCTCGNGVLDAGEQSTPPFPLWPPAVTRRVLAARLLRATSVRLSRTPSRAVWLCWVRLLSQPPLWFLQRPLALLLPVSRLLVAPTPLLVTCT